MSKKHFERIAATIKERLVRAINRRDRNNEIIAACESAEDFDSNRRELAIENASEAAACVNEITDIASDLCRDFESFNANFDRGRFLAACGL